MTIKLNGSTAGSVALDAPASTTSNADITFKLPVADGSANQVIQTNQFQSNVACGYNVGKFRLNTSRCLLKSVLQKIPFVK